MKTFEEKWTAWLDGELRGKELAEFEASLSDRATAEAEKLEAQKLGALLKAQLAPRAMGNEDFFNHQVRERIERESATEVTSTRDSPPGFSWTIGRLIWSGATALAIFAVCTFFVMRSREPADQSQYLSQILNARVDPGMSPYATVSMFQTKEDKITVLWVDGLQSLPAEYAAK
jgi:hypothetical protein